jgi:hypothetical protein
VGLTGVVPDPSYPDGLRGTPYATPAPWVYFAPISLSHTDIRVYLVVILLGGLLSADGAVARHGSQRESSMRDALMDSMIRRRPGYQPPAKCAVCRWIRDCRSVVGGALLR